MEDERWVWRREKKDEGRKRGNSNTWKSRRGRKRKDITKKKKRIKRKENEKQTWKKVKMETIGRKKYVKGKLKNWNKWRKWKRGKEEINSRRKERKKKRWINIENRQERKKKQEREEIWKGEDERTGIKWRKGRRGKWTKKKKREK